MNPHRQSGAMTSPSLEWNDIDCDIGGKVSSHHHGSEEGVGHCKGLKGNFVNGEVNGWWDGCCDSFCRFCRSLEHVPGLCACTYPNPAIM